MRNIPTAVTIAPRGMSFDEQNKLQKGDAGTLTPTPYGAQTIIDIQARKLDALLAHCPDAECAVCASIICDHGDTMHFHHDGCPSCAQDGATEA